MMNVPPPSFQTPSFQPQPFQPRPYNPNYHHHKPYYNKYKHGPQVQDDFDGKRLRKSVMRKTVDYNASIVRALQNRIWQRDHIDRRALQPENSYIPDLMPPMSYLDNPSNSITTRFVKTATNKMRCPVFTLAWTPEGRRLITGASSGEFTLWNGLTFNFETILQAHSTSVRSMVWSHNDNWMVTGDHNGYVKYWQSNMNNVKQFQAHKEPIRGLSFCPTDAKFATCSDDGTVRIFDFLRCHEERVMRGHGADVKTIHWHPQKSIVASGSKDNQQPIKLWDPKSGTALSTLHAHKSTVMDLKWNDNGNWLVTASRDHLLKLFDIRNLKEEMQTFRGHKKEASSVCWHPIHEGLFVSGGSDGQILFWNVGTDKEVGGIEAAHESIVWTLAWHPIGHILCSGSNDHTVKFWTRNRPGDQMRDKYNLNTLPASLAGLEDYEMDEHIVIPGMGIVPNEDQDDDDDEEDDDEDDVYAQSQVGGMNIDVIQKDENSVSSTAETIDNGVIPGLDLDGGKNEKKPYSKPIPKNFVAQWNINDKNDKANQNPSNIIECIQHVVTNVNERIPGLIKIDNLRSDRIIVSGRELDIKFGTKIYQAIIEGPGSFFNYLQTENVIQREDNDDNEPHAKRFRADNFDSSSNDVDLRFGQPGIPSLLNINVGPPTTEQESQKSQPQQQQQNQGNQGPWENNVVFNNNGQFNNTNNNNNQNSKPKTREGRRQGSRWSSRR